MRIIIATAGDAVASFFMKLTIAFINHYVIIESRIMSVVKINRQGLIALAVCFILWRVFYPYS